MEQENIVYDLPNKGTTYVRIASNTETSQAEASPTEDDILKSSETESEEMILEESHKKDWEYS